MEHEQVKYLFKIAKVREDLKTAYYKNLERAVQIRQTLTFQWRNQHKISKV